jgi:glutamyl-Q tRNA(Asp) synthetase
MYIGRFAPSPTGPLHFGSLIAALGSYLQARTAGGSWLLRIEDLDQPRVVAGAAEQIVAVLDQLGFEWHGPVEYQSLRQELYAQALHALLSTGRLFYCTCTRSQLAALSEPQAEELRYPGTCRQRIAAIGIPPPSEPHTIRLSMPDSPLRFVDRLHGVQIEDVAATCGDLLLRRRDGIYSYHLAVVVDDAAQGITEVVRGGDLLSSTARQIRLQQALGLPSPRYCHLPLAVDSAGRKLSKSSQSLAVNPQDAVPLLWHALEFLQQNPPLELKSAKLAELWTWSMQHWNIERLQGHARGAAPLQTFP